MSAVTIERAKLEQWLRAVDMFAGKDRQKALHETGKEMLQALAAQPAPVQEPVAKVCHDLEGHIGWNPRLIELPEEGTELFAAAQPELVPLTEAQLLATLVGVDPNTKHIPLVLKEFARAIEDAHGITAAPEKMGAA